MEAAIALSQHGTVAPITLHNRLDYAASMIDGRTVMEVDPTGKSAVEMLQLWSYLADRLSRIEAPQSGWFDDSPKAAKNVNGLGRSVPSFGRRAYS